jgi:hypothetical protein
MEMLRADDRLSGLRKPIIVCATLLSIAGAVAFAERASAAQAQSGTQGNGSDANGGATPSGDNSDANGSLPPSDNKR